VLNGFLHHLHRVFGQQLQDANILPGPRDRPMTLLEGGPQLLEAGRQRPIVKDEGMIQGRRPATENRQIVTRFDDPFAAGVTASMTGDHHVG